MDSGNHTQDSQPKTNARAPPYPSKGDPELGLGPTASKGVGNTASFNQPITTSNDGDTFQPIIKSLDFKLLAFLLNIKNTLQFMREI